MCHRVVHVSALAPHNAGLGDGAPWSGVVHVPDAPEVDPLRVPPVAVHGHARRIQDPRVLDPECHANGRAG
jgi:hypothetical protein